MEMISVNLSNVTYRKTGNERWIADLGCTEAVLTRSSRKGWCAQVGYGIQFSRRCGYGRTRKEALQNVLDPLYYQMIK